MTSLSKILALATLTVCYLPSYSAAKDNTPYPNFLIERITDLTPELTRLTKDMGPGDLVVFDLDNTIFRETQMLGTDEWYSYILYHLMVTRRLTREQAALQLEPLNRSIKFKSRVKLMEEELPELIHALQMRGIATIGLTARHPGLAESTLKNLHSFGINFSGHSGLQHERLKDFRIAGFNHALSFEEGVIFTDGGKKGVVLKHALLKTGFSPRIIAAVDDRIHHIESFVETLQELEISGVLIHYLKALEEPALDPEIAEAQLQVFTKLGILLSDDEAREFRERNQNVDPPLNWLCSQLLKRFPSR